MPPTEMQLVEDLTALTCSKKMLTGRQENLSLLYFDNMVLYSISPKAT